MGTIFQWSLALVVFLHKGLDSLIEDCYAITLFALPFGCAHAL